MHLNSLQLSRWDKYCVLKCNRSSISSCQCVCFQLSRHHKWWKRIKISWSQRCFQSACSVLFLIEFLCAKQLFYACVNAWMICFTFIFFIIYILRQKSIEKGTCLNIPSSHLMLHSIILQMQNNGGKGQPHLWSCFPCWSPRPSFTTGSL